MEKILDGHLAHENIPPKKQGNEIDALLLGQCAAAVAILVSAWLSMEVCIVLNILITILGWLLIMRAWVSSKGRIILSLGSGHFGFSLVGVWLAVRQGYWSNEVAADIEMLPSLVISLYAVAILVSTILSWMKWVDGEGRH